MTSLWRHETLTSVEADQSYLKTPPLHFIIHYVIDDIFRHFKKKFKFILIIFRSNCRSSFRVRVTHATLTHSELLILEKNANKPYFTAIFSQLKIFYRKWENQRNPKIIWQQISVKNRGWKISFKFFSNKLFYLK